MSALLQRVQFSDGTEYVRCMTEATAPHYPKVIGKDPDGRVVVDMGPHTFGLTLCCNAMDKGTEFGIVCRSCWGEDEVGAYDPVVVHHVTSTHTYHPSPTEESQPWP